MLPTLLTVPAHMTAKLNTIYLKAAKSVLRGNFFRISHKKILDKIGWHSLQAKIELSAVLFIQKLLFHGNPPNMYNLFQEPNRRGKKYSIKEKLSSKFTKNFFIFKSLDLFNTLKNDSTG